MKIFEGKGSISFTNNKLGEIWYKINLLSLECDPIKYPIINAEIGKSKS